MFDIPMKAIKLVADNIDMWFVIKKFDLIIFVFKREKELSCKGIALEKHVNDKNIDVESSLGILKFYKRVTYPTIT